MEAKTSLQALDNLVHCKSETKCKECRHKNLCTMERDYNIIKQDLQILKILKDKLCLYIYDNEPNQLYVAGNTEDITDKEEALLKVWLNHE